MSLPQFNAEAALGPTMGMYRGKVAYGRSGAVAVLPMLPPRPTIDSIGRCFHQGAGESACEGLLCWCCYSDGCWICDNHAGLPTNCVWDPQYRTLAGGPPRPLGGVLDHGENNPRPIPPISNLHASM